MMLLVSKYSLLNWNLWGFVSDKGQEVDHAKLWDDAKQQLKQPSLR